MKHIDMRPDWMVEANCQSVDPDLFFPDEGRMSLERARNAIRVCRACTVIEKCLQWAFDVDDQYAILGGTTVHQRTRIKKKQLKKVA